MNFLHNFCISGWNTGYRENHVYNNKHHADLLDDMLFTEDTFTSLKSSKKPFAPAMAPVGTSIKSFSLDVETPGRDFTSPATTVTPVTPMTPTPLFTPSPAPGLQVCT